MRIPDGARVVYMHPAAFVPTDYSVVAFRNGTVGRALGDAPATIVIFWAFRWAVAYALEATPPYSLRVRVRWPWQRVAFG